MAAHCFLIFLSLILLPLPSTLGISNGNVEGYNINGKVRFPGFSATGLGLPAKSANVKVILNGGQKVTFLKPDGYFSFHNVPAGTHLIEVAAIGYFFSPIRVDVSARNPGKVQAALTENRRVLTELILEPLREEQYYELREPFNVMSILKSPMGLMIGFMAIVVFLMPKLVDAEELKRAQEEMGSQGVPSLANLLGGAKDKLDKRIEKYGDFYRGLWQEWKWMSLEILCFFIRIIFATFGFFPISAGFLLHWRTIILASLFLFHEIVKCLNGRGKTAFVISLMN